MNIAISDILREYRYYYRFCLNIYIAILFSKPKYRFVTCLNQTLEHLKLLRYSSVWLMVYHINRFNAIILLVCHLSKMGRLMPTHSEGSTKPTIRQNLFKEIFLNYLLPESIVADRGVQWNTEFFRELYDVADIRLK